MLLGKKKKNPFQSAWSFCAYESFSVFFLVLKIFYTLYISNSAKHGCFPFSRRISAHRPELSNYSRRVPMSNLFFGLCHPAQTRLWTLEHCCELFLLSTEAPNFTCCHFQSLDKRLESSDPPLWSPGCSLPPTTVSSSSGVSSTPAFHWKCFSSWRLF